MYTRDKASEFLQNGMKITHQNFTDGEYITLGKKGLVTEDGYSFDERFWTDPMFETGWSVYSESY